MTRTDTTRRCELCGREVGTKFYRSDVGWLCAEHFLKAEHKYEPAISAAWDLRALVSEKNARIKELEATVSRLADELKSELLYTASLENWQYWSETKRAAREADLAKRIAELDALIALSPRDDTEGGGDANP